MNKTACPFVSNTFNLDRLRNKVITERVDVTPIEDTGKNYMVRTHDEGYRSKHQQKGVEGSTFWIVRDVEEDQTGTEKGY